MLASATLAVVLIDDKGPGLPTSLEALGYRRDRVGFCLGWAVFVVECDVDLPSFIIDGL